ncbi:DUF58 domain-containing protein [Microbacterium amylolyticum]|uniref:Uncharacterized protein (DUF58 family) n=1 Tax=Microbacterium amylolyticum TaxID=936337 RepID=A0ABS4ZJX2_9MICO|nr:DUF58 domain-containing protein [Microbacterium amylolyticum]MBP2437590.1 uncharacterized protein (DUF58 family) [Microbacterium amylolyticum]
MFVTGRFPLLVAAGALPLVLLPAAGFSAWAVLAAWIVVCAAAVAVDVAAAASPGALRISRDVPARTKLGERTVTRVQIINGGHRRAHLTARDAWQPTAGAPSDRLSATIPSRESRVFEVPLLPRRRGELRSEFMTVRLRGPLGFAGRQASLAAPGAIRVLPPFRARRHLASRVQRLRELDGSTSLQVRGQGTEFDSLREYIRGDDVRSIDWRATARAGTTMLRTWRPERDRHVTIVIDTGRTAAARVDDETRLDASFEAAMLLAALANRAGDHVHLLAYDRVTRARVTGVDGNRLLPDIADELAPVEAQLIDTGWDGAFSAAQRLARRPSLIVVLTAQESIASSRRFLSALASLPSAGTTVLVGTVTDTTIAPSPLDSAAGVSELFHAAAAEQTAQEAEAVARAISRAGAEAIADSAESLPPRIADRYLALKKAGRL